MEHVLEAISFAATTGENRRVPLTMKDIYINCSRFRARLVENKYEQLSQDEDEIVKLIVELNVP